MGNPVKDYAEQINYYVGMIVDHYEQELEFLRQDNAELAKKLKIIKEKALTVEAKVG